MTLNNLPIRFFFSLMVLLMGFSYQLRLAKTDYYLALFLILVSFTPLIFCRKKLVGKFDLGWLVSFLVALTYIFYAYYDGYSLQVILIQSLIFLMPLISLMSRQLDLQINNESITKLLIILVTIKLVVFLTQSSLVIHALTSSGERARFHDYTSIILALVLFPALLYGYIKQLRYKVYLSFALLLFLATAAHRSLYIAILIQTLVWFVTYKGMSSERKVKYLLVAVVISLVVVSFTNFGRLIIGLFDASVSGNDGNTNFRMELYYAVASNWYSEFFGLGFGRPYIYGFDSSGEPVFYALHHNSYLTYLYYIGVFPMLFYVFSSIHLFLNRSRNRDLEFLKSALLGMSIFAIFNLFFEHPLYAICYWVVFGIYMRRSILY